jgi:hypothetical protein
MSKNALHDPIWFTPPDGSSRVLLKDSPAPPPAPDYTGAAVATAQGNQQAATQATKANRVNQYSPYGSSIYSQADPSDPNSQWSQNISLSPVGQQLLDSLNQSQLGTAGLEQGATNTVANTLNQPFDQTSPQASTDKAYANITSRLDPQWNQRQQQQETQLRNQGVAPGSEAYDNAMRDFNYGRNDAYTQANTQAMQFAPQTYQLGLAQREQPLNELNAIRTGSQVTTPQFGNVPQQQTVGGPNYSGATQATGTYDQNLYNQQVAQANAFNGGLFSLGGAALGNKGLFG